MAEIVNLRKFRKAKQRADKEKSAVENRIKFGRSKNERAEIAARKVAVDRELDGARREGGKGADTAADDGET